MAKIVLVTGGSRSGKSRYAVKLAESLGGRRVFVATCPVVDDELRERVRRHQQERASRQWETIEEPVDLAGVLSARADCEVVLVDCLTLWVNNLMYEAERRGEGIDEDAVAGLMSGVLAVCRRRRGVVIFVTNEVGMGVVPENASARKYRDLVGRCNQVAAAEADVVTLVTCGIPLTLKEKTGEEST